MIAMERGRTIRGMGMALAALWVVGTEPALAQQTGKAKGTAAAPASPPRAATPDPSRAAAAAPDAPRLQLTAIPVNPTDPIALVNGESITRQQLADECVARRGEEILETLVARRLIEQALRAQRKQVTAQEIDQEIENVARQMAGIGREAWLRTLEKERGISPVQYARDIIYPALALRKLAADRVQVSKEDLKNAFDAQYGEKLRCRLIMVDKLRTAQEIWEMLRKNPAGFEKLAQERSMDSGSRSLGGLLAEPITRHAYPQNVSDAAFRQLVDGDPEDKDPAHKPKDGDFTGPVQVAEATWIILRREGVIPAQRVDPNNEQIRKATYEMIYQVKLKEAMNEYFANLMHAASIDNKLTGRIKLANEEDNQADETVRLMGHEQQNPPPAPTPSPGRTKLPTPVGISPDEAKALQPTAVRK
jgi:parvulin-like peptidyl-prolyl isomerase